MGVPGHDFYSLCQPTSERSRRSIIAGVAIQYSAFFLGIYVSDDIFPQSVIYPCGLGRYPGCERVRLDVCELIGRRNDENDFAGFAGADR